MLSMVVSTSGQTELVPITGKVNELIGQATVSEGLCTLFVPHTTAGITINESFDPDVAADMLSYLNDLVPMERNYRHDEGNSAAHIKASLVGTSLTFPIEAGRASLGQWQGIFFCEFDGPRNRTVWMRILGHPIE